MTSSEYFPNLARGTRVRFTGKADHPKNGKCRTILGALPNPSGRAENQWYDVRFDDQSLARLVERYLQEEVKADNGQTAATGSLHHDQLMTQRDDLSQADGVFSKDNG
jgi:hypothetical protein